MKKNHFAFRFVAILFVAVGVSVKYSVAQDVFGRRMAWDSIGVLPLNGEREYRPDEKKLFVLLDSSELGKADLRARSVLVKNPDSFVAAWVIIQCARVRRTTSILYREAREKNGLKVEPAVRAYLRFNAVRMMVEETPALKNGTINTEWEALRKELRETRQECTPYVTKHLPLLAAIAQNRETPVGEARKIVEEYARLHPDNRGVRLLLCRTYVRGELVGEVGRRSIVARRFKLSGKNPQEPQPNKIAAICEAILAKNPDDSAARYYLGRALYILERDREAAAEFKKVAESADALPVFRNTAKNFLTADKPSEVIFSQVRLIE